jgi:hypothetical protein
MVRYVPSSAALTRSDAMEPLIHFAGLVAATLLAVATAAALDWLLLQGMFQLMKPATARRPHPLRSEFVNATRELAQHFAAQPKL